MFTFMLKGEILNSILFKPSYRKRNGASYMKYSINVLPRCWMRLRALRSSVTSKHLVNRTNYVEHFFLADKTIAVKIVKTKNPLELLFGRSSGYFGEDGQKFLWKKNVRSLGIFLFFTINYDPEVLFCLFSLRDFN